MENIIELNYHGLDQYANRLVDDEDEMVEEMIALVQSAISDDEVWHYARSLVGEDRTDINQVNLIMQFFDRYIEVYFNMKGIRAPLYTRMGAYELALLDVDLEREFDPEARRKEWRSKVGLRGNEPVKPGETVIC